MKTNQSGTQIKSHANIRGHSWYHSCVLFLVETFAMSLTLNHRQISRQKQERCWEKSVQLLTQWQIYFIFVAWPSVYVEKVEECQRLPGYTGAQRN